MRIICLTVVRDLFVNEKQGAIIFSALIFILKGGSLMDWLDNMNATMEYIEMHPADEISYDRAAQMAC